MRHELRHWAMRTGPDDFIVFVDRGDAVLQLDVGRGSQLGDSAHYEAWTRLLHRMLDKETPGMSDWPKTVEDYQEYVQAIGSNVAALVERIKELEETVRRQNDLLLCVEGWQPGVEPAEVSKVMQLANYVLSGNNGDASA